jgi:hypothetical protein
VAEQNRHSLSNSTVDTQSKCRFVHRDELIIRIETYRQVLINRLVSLTRCLSKGSYYECPDINILRIGGKELEELWERILPTPAQAARRQLSESSTSDVGPVVRPKTPSYSELLSQRLGDFATRPMPGGFPGTSAGPSGFSGVGAGPSVSAGVTGGPSVFPEISAGPSAYGDHNYGYEVDRPTTSEG